jgi:hypothetical protein
LPPEQRPKVDELKHSIVDVKRVVYNVAKAYTNQLDVGQTYPDLNDVIGISICDFEQTRTRLVFGSRIVASVRCLSE